MSEVSRARRGGGVWHRAGAWGSQSGAPALAVRHAEGDRPLLQAGANGLLFKVLLIVLMGMSLLAPFINNTISAGGGEGSALRQITYLGVVALTLLLTVDLTNPVRVFVLPVSVVLALAWCWSSLIWSIDPSTSLRRVILLTLVVWGAFALVKALRYEDTISTIRLVLLGTLVLNYIVVIFFPSLGIHQIWEPNNPGIVGSWRGALMQKNFCGPICVITILFFLFHRGNYALWMRVGVMLAAAFFLYQTNSKTSMGMGIFSLLVGVIVYYYDTRYRLYLIPLTFLSVAVCLPFWSTVTDFIPQILAQRGAFTGRTDIWRVLVEIASTDPWLGVGYGAFWNLPGAQSPIYAYSDDWVMLQGNGHNGYLDLVLSVGIPGLLLTVAALIVMPLLNLAASSRPQRGQRALLVSLTLFVALQNSMESTIFDRDMATGLILVIAAALTHIVTSRSPSPGDVRRA
ncbi:exopolysaccharide production protein, putative [Parvularcula bermudensis HTCC2503]|uniref:Exopolysaccharide production protein, putative n=1 Tax=Parvularcula bermudensis (strain ATCC BAA-594 / HTCC2503 / KCTC 12087) TaxID=314260 RepID=E0TI84_PARBH|nr:O-antigen ligase family protein [Parvularcula bermudensis]ADM09423.1 exopolysaccharide production protein, putative [Parvularcula bermudensis HTCC2503]